MPTIDFDAFRAERNAEPVRLLIGGVTYALPPSLPAAVALDLIRMKAETGEGFIVPVTEIEVWSTRLLGDAAPGILAQLGFDELAMLLERLLAVYSPGPVPNRAARRAKTAASRS